MSGPIRHSEGEGSPLARLSRPTGRRDFLRWTGVGAAGLFIAACDEETRTITEVTPPDTIITPPDTVEVQPTPPPVTLDFSDANAPFTVLNYAFALEQLEAAFYTMVVQTGFFAGATEEEIGILSDLRSHEVAHREFFRAKIRELGGTPLTGLVFDFSVVDFGDRMSVLQTAQVFENLGVWAYNGAASLIETGAVLQAAADIVSVEARHAAAIQDLLAPPIFFIDDAFDKAYSPDRVLNEENAGKFIVNEITVTGLPAPSE